MTFPTEGFNTQIVHYSVITEGDASVSMSFDVDRSVIGNDTLTEDVLTVLDGSLVSMASALENVTGVTAVHVYKSYRGATTSTDLNA